MEGTESNARQGESMILVIHSKLKEYHGKTYKDSV